SIYLSILLFVGLGISSCQEHGQEITGTDLTNTLEVSDPELYEQKLEQLSLYMGEVFKDREALRELFELAEADEHKEDIDYSLKQLFETNENPMTRQRSAIVNSFYRNAANHRTSGEDLDPQELIDFINANNISMLAPYMVGYFNLDSIQELTVSWWTKEMEEEGLAGNPDWEGETPGYRLRLGEDGNFIRFRAAGANYFTSGKVLVGDDYAVENPTVVFGNFDDEFLPPGDGGIGGGGSNDPNVEPRLPHELGVNCSNERSGDIVRWYMPHFRLTGNTRSWPHPNRITIWINASTNQSTVPFINEKKITRGEVGNTWLSGFIPNDGLIATSWEQINYNQNIVMAFKKPSNRVKETVVVFGAKQTSAGVYETTSSATVRLEKSMHKTFLNQAWLRCGELNGNYRVSVGNGLEDGIAIYSYSVSDNGAKCEFTLAPKVIRF
ncbi:MAG: hypothetical protein NXH89_01665, partial [Cyclobacteriaceae bacterium]|nr:hypothetical protein [Cyclobacteriaceae bacterium]